MDPRPVFFRCLPFAEFDLFLRRDIALSRCGLGRGRCQILADFVEKLDC